MTLPEKVNLTTGTGYVAHTSSDPFRCLMLTPCLVGSWKNVWARRAVCLGMLFLDAKMK